MLRIAQDFLSDPFRFCHYCVVRLAQQHNEKETDMIKVIFSNGKPLSIDVTNLPKNVGHVDGDKIATEIGKQIGRNLGAVRIGGYWIIGDTTDNKWFPIYGHQAGQQTRSFEKLLREGLQLGTVRMVPLKPKATK